MKSRTAGVNCERKHKIFLQGNEENPSKIVSIKTIDGKPLWHLVRSFINHLKVNQEFSRKELLEAVYTPDAAQAIRARETSVDHYRLYACHIGFLEHISNGRYKKLVDIPEKMTVTDLKKFAYNKAPWQDWFIPKKQKLKDIMKKYGGVGEVV